MIMVNYNIYNLNDFVKYFLHNLYKILINLLHLHEVFSHSLFSSCHELRTLSPAQDIVASYSYYSELQILL